MKNLNIEINNSRIIGFRVEMDETQPSVTATIGLFSGEKKISEFSASTRNYYGTEKIEISTRLMKSMIEMCSELETVVTLACSSAIGELPAHEEI